MEPQMPAPRPNPEQSPSQYGQSAENRPYSLSEIGRERYAETREQLPDPNAIAAIASSISLPTPVMATPVPVSDDNNTTASDGSPLVANDDDLIEKEWVDKAKRIISDTRDDPYRREEEISRLQVDYLRKRYGKELGASF